MKGFLKEFKEFILQGNVLNLAVGVIIGGAFQGIVTSLTDNVLSPIIGLFAGQNFDFLSVTIMGAELKYGAFITSIINFLIMAFVVFLIVKGLGKASSIGKKKEKEADPTTKECPYCMSEINKDATRCPSCTSQLG